MTTKEKADKIISKISFEHKFISDTDWIEICMSSIEHTIDILEECEIDSDEPCIRWFLKQQREILNELESRL